jgi:hypothetical protein
VRIEPENAEGNPAGREVGGERREPRAYFLALKMVQIFSRIFFDPDSTSGL